MDYIDLISDTSSSDKTIVIENDEIDDILTKYNDNKFSSEMCTSTNKEFTNESKKNIYNLDGFSDEETENADSRINSIDIYTNPGTQKSSYENFCENSNDSDTVVDKIDQLESEHINHKTKRVVSKEVEMLIAGDILDSHKASSSQYQKRTNNIFSYNESFSNEAFKFKETQTEVVRSDSSSVDLNLEERTVGEPTTKKLRKKNINCKAQRFEKENARSAKAKEKEQKKIEKENEKQLKNALKVVENCIKPDQCIQYVTVNIDDNITKKDYGEVIKAGLKSGGYNYSISNQIVPNLISWTRRVPTIDNMILNTTHQQEMHYMLVMDLSECLQNIENNTIIAYIQSIMSMTQAKHLSIGILGLQSYYKYLRDINNREFKSAVTDIANTKKVNMGFHNLPKLSKKQIDQKLVELQIFCKNIYIRPVEKFEDLAVFVGECTKSVAQIPFKLARTESLDQENEFFSVNNRDCVGVDKNGNGLGRLWNQFLKMFPLASLETAEAVSCVYPTLHSLMEAYNNCRSHEEGERLLQDLPVRRAAGPLGCQRKLGPEFSKKAYRFFCSKENILL